MLRHDARKEAFVLLFQSIDNPSELQATLDEIIQRKPELASQRGYISAVAAGAVEEDARLEAEIRRALTGNRSYERISKIAVTILKLAAYEMLFVADVPPRSAINEAVELAKEYADPETARFVNGVLGGIYRNNIK